MENKEYTRFSSKSNAEYHEFCLEMDKRNRELKKIKNKYAINKYKEGLNIATIKFPVLNILNYCLY